MAMVEEQRESVPCIETTLNKMKTESLKKRNLFIELLSSVETVFWLIFMFYYSNVMDSLLLIICQFYYCGEDLCQNYNIIKPEAAFNVSVG